MSVMTACAVPDEHKKSITQTQVEYFHGLTESEKWIGFDWASAENHGVTYERAAMMIHFRDTSTNESLQLQFDTGVPKNLLYEKALSENSKSKTSRLVNQGEERESLDVKFEGNFPKTAVNFSFKKDLNPNDAEDDGAPLVGTLGLEFLGDTGFAIDYPRQRIYILSAATLDQLEGRYFRSFHPYLSSYKHLNNKIVLPFEMEGQKDVAIFDTGTSMFEITLPQEKWKILSRGSFDQADKKMNLPSWGEYIDVYGKVVQLRIALGGQHLDVTEIYSSSSPSQNWLNIIGNKLFFNRIVIFDKRKNIYSIF
ncbi:hypothetical protein AAFF27_12320 [Xylophilus sp. GW821-FHT01B05]